MLPVDGLADMEALSYTWGSFEKSATLTVGTVSGFVITRNYFAALRGLRRSEGCRRLRTDAICINQTDNTEESRQLPLMETIYARATKILVGTCASIQGSRNLNIRALVSIRPKLASCVVDFSYEKIGNGVTFSADQPKRLPDADRLSQTQRTASCFVATTSQP